MIKNFFRIVSRNFLKNKGFTIINVLGLSTGLAATLLILLWIEDEFSFEKFNKNVTELYRVEEDQFYSGARYHVTVTPHIAGPVWKQKIPEIKEQTRIYQWMPRLLFRKGEKVFFETTIGAVDSSMLNMFSLDFLAGDPATALNAPRSIILTETLARKYFGKDNPIGEVLTVENKYEFTVTGIIRNLPSNTMFTFKALIPYSFMRETGLMDNGWGNNSTFTFVQIKKGADLKSVGQKMTGIVKENAPQVTTLFSVFPLPDIHLHGQFGFTETRGPVITVTIFMLIAIFVLLIACINFINLATAKASGRAREIGVKKVSGADQKSLIIQFMLESLLLVAVSMIVALVIVGLCLGIFNSVSGKQFAVSDLFQGRFIIGVIATALMAGVISGVYPALYLSSFKPVSVLKGDPGSLRGSGRLRQILVIIQFSLSILIAASAVFMFKQLRYMQNKDLGYNKENLICIPMSDNMKPKYQSLKKELEKETLLQGVTASLWNPTMMGSNSGGASWEGKDPEKQVLIGTNAIDYDYIKTLNMKLVYGRDLSREFSSDLARDSTGSFLINEEVAKIMGTGDPTGKKFNFMGVSGVIVGVLKNFHFKGADQAIEPMAFILAPVDYLNNILIRLTPGKVPESLKAVEKVWKEAVPEYPLEYTFIDQDYERLFRSQIRIMNLLKYFTILAVIIACLGLYGLSAYSTSRRTNEVGIRKVMGASPLNIIYTLSMEFMALILIAIVIAIPVAWIVVSKLLNQFAYRVEINPLIIIAIALGAILIALATVSFQAFRATRINPARALKIE